MKKSIFYILAGIAVLLVVAAVAFYVIVFGTSLSTSHNHWGLFGDYFGGLLNPIFAMLAFIALLWSILLQAHEFRSASEVLSNQAKSSEEQLRILRNSRIREDLIHVIKEIDEKLDHTLSQYVTVPGSNPQLSITHMVMEGQRLARGSDTSDSYSGFIRMARTSGSVIEAHIRELIFLLGKMREFLEQYSQFEQSSYSPVILYYSDKCYRLLDMLEDIGGIESDTRQFFATVSDRHG